MKLAYLFYNSILKDYTLTHGKNPYDVGKRLDFGEIGAKGLVEKLRGFLDLKRKTILFINSDFPEDHKQEIESFLKATKVKLEVKKGL
ncbi:MAG: hypothetical protein AABX88_02860 [Nanoarchaeota archaeon]